MQYDFQGRNDLVKFVKTVAEAGLYVHLRIGPYVCAEWNYGCGEFLDFLSLFFISLEVREDSSNLPRLTKKLVFSLSCAQRLPCLAPFYSWNQVQDGQRALQGLSMACMASIKIAKFS